MAKRTYSTDAIEVHWDSERCIHTGWCANNLLAVFNPKQHPWVQLEQGELDDIVAVVEGCPSGALTYTRTDGGPQEQLVEPATIIPWPNGPYHVKGAFQVEDRHGELFETGPRATLCRCGQSSRHPFCDLSHRDVKFHSYPRVADPETNSESQ